MFIQHFFKSDNVPTAEQVVCKQGKLMHYLLSKDFRICIMRKFVQAGMLQ